MTYSAATGRHTAGRAFWRDPSGATTVEFAIVGSVLTVLLFAVVEFGLVAYRRNTAAEAARFGARFAMVRSSMSGRSLTDAQLQDTIRARMAETGVNVTRSFVPTTVTNATSKPGNRVKIVVSYQTTLHITNLFPTFSVSDTAHSVIVY